MYYIRLWDYGILIAIDALIIIRVFNIIDTINDIYSLE